MSAVEEIFDDANGDLAIGDLESAVEKYRRCVELDPGVFRRLARLGNGADEDRAFPGSDRRRQNGDRAAA